MLCWSEFIHLFRFLFLFYSMHDRFTASYDDRRQNFLDLTAAAFKLKCSLKLKLKFCVSNLVWNFVFWILSEMLSFEYYLKCCFSNLIINVDFQYWLFILTVSVNPWNSVFKCWLVMLSGEVDFQCWPSVPALPGMLTLSVDLLSHFQTWDILHLPYTWADAPGIELTLQLVCKCFFKLLMT